MPDKGWFTPFDPRIHVRKADFSKFKKEAKNKDVNWILDHLDDFRAARTIEYLPDFAANYYII